MCCQNVIDLSAEVIETPNAKIQNRRRPRTRGLQRLSNPTNNTENEKLQRIKIQPGIPRDGTTSEERPLVDLGEFETFENMNKHVAEKLQKENIRHGDYFVAAISNCKRAYFQYRETTLKIKESKFENDHVYIDIGNNDSAKGFKLKKTSKADFELDYYGPFPTSPAGFRIEPIYSYYDKNGNVEFKLKKVKLDAGKHETKP